MLRDLAIWFVVALPFAPSVFSIVGMAPWCFSDSAPLRCEAIVALAGPMVLVADAEVGGDLMSELPEDLLTAGLLSGTITGVLALRGWRRRRREALTREAAAATFEG